MFRKLSIAVLVLLGASAGAQKVAKKVTNIPFCARPTLSQTYLNPVTGPGLIGLLAAAGAVTPITGLAGTYVSPLFPGTCAAAGPTRVGFWAATCQTDVLSPVVVRIGNVAIGGVADQAALAAACTANPPPTALQTGANLAICSAQVAVTENTPKNKHPGSSAFYGYVPTVTYGLVGGFQTEVFAAAAAAVTPRFCVYWPTVTAAVGQSAGGTGKWAKPVINTIATTSAFTNAPVGVVNQFLAGAAGALPITLFTTGPLLAPQYQQSITVNYLKTYLDWALL